VAFTLVLPAPTARIVLLLPSKGLHESSHNPIVVIVTKQSTCSNAVYVQPVSGVVGKEKLWEVAIFGQTAANFCQMRLRVLKISVFS